MGIANGSTVTKQRSTIPIGAVQEMEPNRERLHQELQRILPRHSSRGSGVKIGKAVSPTPGESAHEPFLSDTAICPFCGETEGGGERIWMMMALPSNPDHQPLMFPHLLCAEQVLRPHLEYVEGEVARCSVCAAEVPGDTGVIHSSRSSMLRVSARVLFISHVACVKKHIDTGFIFAREIFGA